MGQELRVDTAGVQAMATRWGSAVSELNVEAPMGLGLSCQTSAAAVEAAHAEVATFTAGLSARVDTHASHVVKADSSYVAQEAESTAALAALAQPMASE